MAGCGVSGVVHEGGVVAALMFVVGPALPVFTTLSITVLSFTTLIMVRQRYFCNWSRLLLRVFFALICHLV